MGAMSPPLLAIARRTEEWRGVCWRETVLKK